MIQKGYGVTKSYVVHPRFYWRHQANVLERIFLLFKFYSISNPKIAKKEEWAFVESACNMQGHIVKNTLLHTAFSAILSAGIAS